MSSERRPWYKWYPKDFVADEKVKSLSPLSELVYRRLLDTMWQSSACVLLNDCLRLANVAGSGLSAEEFQKAWSEIQTEGYELFKITDDGRFIYSSRMDAQLQELENKRKSGKKGGQASAKQRASKKQAKPKQTGKQSPTDTDTDTDINKPPISPLLKYLISQIESSGNGIKAHQEKIIEFFNHRMKMPKAKQYKTEKGIDGLLRDCKGCLEIYSDLNECIEITMQKETWLTPDPEYLRGKAKEKNPADIGGGDTIADMLRKEAEEERKLFPWKYDDQGKMLPEYKRTVDA